MNVKNQIITILQEKFCPEYLDVIDESHKHIGHAGYREGGQTHFKVVISSDDLKPVSRIEAQRMVYTALGDLMRETIHALELKIIR